MYNINNINNMNNMNYVFNVNKLNYNDFITIIMRQTSYTEDIAKQKLEEWDNDHISVIKEYYGLKKKPSDESKKITSINQDIYKNIRNFMDSTSSSLNNNKNVKKKSSLDQINETDS